MQRHANGISIVVFSSLMSSRLAKPAMCHESLNSLGVFTTKLGQALAGHFTVNSNTTVRLNCTFHY